MIELTWQIPTWTVYPLVLWAGLSLANEVLAAVIMFLNWRIKRRIERNKILDQEINHLRNKMK